MIAPKKKRVRSAAGETLERAWWRRRQELFARAAANIPPRPDPTRQPREFMEWAQKHAQRELPPEWQQLYEDMRELPTLKFRRDRDHEAWGWIYQLLVRQGQGAPYDLLTCSLGANPANPNARPSKMLRYLVATVAQKYPGFGDNPNDARRLYDAIRTWRKSRERLRELQSDPTP